MKRPSWNDYWFAQVELVATRSTCLRRHVGAVIVSMDNRLLTTGYNGAPSGVQHCFERGCPREKFPSGMALNLCVGTHAEMNAVANAARKGVKIEGAKIYLSIMPCQECLKPLQRIVQESGIKMIKYKEE